MAKEKKFKKRISLLFILTITAVACFNYYKQYQVYSHIDDGIRDFDEQIYNEKEKQVELKQQQQYYQSDEYIEDKAREKFKLVGEDEKIYIIQEDKSR